jgi:CheY-like chemotaxis protein
MVTDGNDIVVVDDNPALLTVLSEIFKEHGYTVRTASDGFEALAVIRDREPGILISDLNMPGMSGFELLSVVRRRFPAIAVIAMSGTYSDASLSSEIAADSFYAKGSTSAGGLLDILRKI